MYDIIVETITSDEKYEFRRAKGGLYDKETELFQVRDVDGATFYFPRENTIMFVLKKTESGKVTNVNKEDRI